MSHNHGHDSSQITIGLGKGSEQHDHGNAVVLYACFYGNSYGVRSRLAENKGHDETQAEATPGQEEGRRHYERVTGHHTIDVRVDVQPER